MNASRCRERVVLWAFAAMLALSACSGGRAATEEATPDSEPFEVVEWVDSDGDGFRDPNDLCPLEPEDYDGLGDDDGCPEVDHDGDDVADEEDLCPEQQKHQGRVGLVSDWKPLMGCFTKHALQCRMQFPGVYFPIDSVAGEFTPVQADFVGKYIIERALSEDPEPVLYVEGVANEGENEPFVLACARARIVHAALLERGYPPELFEVVGAISPNPAKTTVGRFAWLYPPCNGTLRNIRPCPE